MPAPRDPVKKEIWKNNLSKSHKGIQTWNKGIKMPEDFRIKMGKLSLKFWNNPDSIDKIKIRNAKISESKKGDKNPMKRLELRRKHSLIMKGKLVGDKNPMRRLEARQKLSAIKKGRPVPLLIRKKISTTLTGKLVGSLNPFYGKHHSLEVREKSRIRAINQIVSGSLRNRRTSIELKILEELGSRGVNFIEQHPLEGITVVDFYLPKFKVVIYCDGSFWHTGKWALQNKVIEKDKKQTLFLEKSGYKVFRFSEDEINTSSQTCIDVIEKYIKTISL